MLYRVLLVIVKICVSYLYSIFIKHLSLKYSGKKMYIFLYTINAYYYTRILKKNSLFNNFILFVFLLFNSQIYYTPTHKNHT